MKCKKCKKEIPDDAIFCPYCGINQNKSKQKTRKRGNGTGSIYQLPNKKWRAAIVEYYYRNKNGNIVAKYKTRTCDRKSEAVNALAELKQSVTEKPENKSMTLEELYSLYTNTKKYASLSQSQKDKMRFAWNKMQALHFVKISDLTLDDMQRTIDNATSSYYPARDMKVLLSHIYTMAIQREQETINKSQYIELPNPPKAKRQAFTEQEIEKFWNDYNSGHEFTGFILMLIYTGMRVGELFRLVPESFHIEDRYIIGGEKTAAGKDREIPISIKIFPIVKKFYDEGRFPLRNIWKFYDDYKETLKRLGIRDLPAQTCRHTYFTMLARNEVHPALIASIGGHSQYEVAINNYNRIPLEDKIKAVDKLRNKIDNK